MPSGSVEAPPAHMSGGCRRATGSGAGEKESTIGMSVASSIANSPARARSPAAAEAAGRQQVGRSRARPRIV
eukprot:5387266-Prymnesium_polylepis.1